MQQQIISGEDVRNDWYILNVQIMNKYTFTTQLIVLYI